MSEDLRVTKTRQNIQMTFIRLLEQCRFQDITIKQLIQECQINRSTFYRNYEDKYDLIQKIADELLVQFQKAINPGFIALNGKKENYRNLLGGLYRENPVKSRNYEAVKSSKKWENVGNSYIIPALLLYRYSYI